MNLGFIYLLVGFKVHNYLFFYSMLNVIIYVYTYNMELLTIHLKIIYQFPHSEYQI